MGYANVGRWEYGQLGRGNTESSYIPLTVSGIFNVSFMGAGLRSTCSVDNDRNIKCWGFNGAGLGYGHTDNLGDDEGEMDNLQTVALGSKFIVDAVTSGYWHRCASSRVTQEIKCWGSDQYGQIGAINTLGDEPGEMGDQLLAIDLGASFSAIAMSSGDGSIYHHCALSQDASFKCWGLNQYGRLGTGDRYNRGGKFGGMGDALPVINIRLTAEPTATPTAQARLDPTSNPTRNPTADPTADPISDTAVDTTMEPTVESIREPTWDPTTEPTIANIKSSTAAPTTSPITSPPTLQNPTLLPTSNPSLEHDGESGETSKTSTTSSNTNQISDEQTAVNTWIYVFVFYAHSSL